MSQSHGVARRLICVAITSVTVTGCAVVADPYQDYGNEVLVAPPVSLQLDLGYYHGGHGGHGGHGPYRGRGWGRHH